MRDRVFQVSLPASLAIQPSGPRRGQVKTLNHLMVLAALAGCNGHPLAPLEDDLVATRRREHATGFCCLTRRNCGSAARRGRRGRWPIARWSRSS